MAKQNGGSSMGMSCSLFFLKKYNYTRPLTQNGEDIIKRRAPVLVGEGKLLDPSTICHAIVSPRIRARRTFELLFSGLPEPPRRAFSEDVCEWDYGDYEGLTPSQIKEKDKYFSIWHTGCSGGESSEEMTRRVDRVIEKVLEIHRQYFEEGIGHRDVVIVTHGHFSRVFIARWVQFPLCLGDFGPPSYCDEELNVFNLHFNFEPAGMAILSYNLEEPALNALNLYADHN